MDIEKIGLIIVFLTVIGSSWLDDIRTANMEKRLSESIIKYATAEANATRERIYNDMNNNIEREHNETVTELDNSDVIDFGN